jgi:hypothetical protein
VRRVVRERDAYVLAHQDALLTALEPQPLTTVGR